MPTRSRNRGASLAELLVSLLLMGALTALAGALMRYGSHYIKATDAQLEMQRGALLALNWMTRDLSESSPVAIHTNPWGTPPIPPQPPVAGPPRGVVLASPRDADGQITFSGGKIQWNSRICYYLDINSGGKIYRVKETHSPTDLPDVINPNVEDTSHFHNNRASLEHRLLANRVTYLDVQRQVTGVEITLEAANDDRTFSVLVKTLVHPKN